MTATKKINVGAKFGTCKNCGFQVQVRQPWLTLAPIVDDGWYLVHCTNDACHNYYGMEVREDELDYVDFIDDEMMEKENEQAKIVNLQEYVNEVRKGGILVDRY